MVLRCLLCLTILSRVNVQLTLVRFRWIPHRWFTKLLNKTKLPLAQHAQNSKHVDTLSMNEGPQVHLFCQSKSGFVHSFVVRSSFLAIQTRKKFDSQTPLHWYSLKIGWLNQALLSSGWVIWVWIAEMIDCGLARTKFMASRSLCAKVFSVLASLLLALKAAADLVYAIDIR